MIGWMVIVGKEMECDASGELGHEDQVVVMLNMFRVGLSLAEMQVVVYCYQMMLQTGFL